MKRARDVAEDDAMALGGGQLASTGRKLAREASAQITVFVKRTGAAMWAEVDVTVNSSVAHLTEVIAAKLSLEHLDCLTLHVATNAAGTLLGDALDSRTSVAAAGIAHHTSVVVKTHALASPSALTSAIILRPDASTADVYSALGDDVRRIVDAARAHRVRLTGLRALTELTVSMTAEAARGMGITVLREDAHGHMAVGMISIPPLDANVALPPKTFDDLLTRYHKLLLLPQRLERAFELVDAVQSGQPLGLHLSGPNGVGKSAIALLAYFLCVARGLIAVYISRAETWVSDAEAGRGEAFFFDVLWRQNADLIIEHPALRSTFEWRLKGEQVPSDAMASLRTAVRGRTIVGVAVILDEVQHITEAVKLAKQERATPAVINAGRYFQNNWYDWTNDNVCFRRMSVASAHSERDTKLPDGEALRRLRIIEPLDPLDRAALQEHPDSPAFVKDLTARERVVYIAGNGLRKLVEGAQLLPRDRAPTKAELLELRLTMWAGMMKDCQNWLASLDENSRITAAHSAMDIVSGKVEWGNATILYDSGIVYRSVHSMYVRPVSPVAASVVLRVLAAHTSASRKPLRTFVDGRERGFELERQVLARLDSFASDRGMPTKLLNGEPAPSVDLRCSYSLPFTSLEEVVSRELPILYRPTSGTFACDAIRMPAADDPDGMICFVECSTTDPTSSARVAKIMKWFQPAGVATELLTVNNRRRGVVVLFYDDVLALRKFAALSAELISLSAVEMQSAPGTAAPTIARGLRESEPSAAASSAASGMTSMARSSDGIRPSLARAAKHAVPPTDVRVGDSVRVVDASLLSEPLGLLL